MNQPAALAAKRLLNQAAQRLNTANPVPVVGPVLDASLAFPIGYRENGHFEPTYTEPAPGTLAFVVDPSERGATARDRLDLGVRTMRQLVYDNFGPQALRFADGRLEPIRDDRRSVSYTTTLGTGFDQRGLSEAMITTEWGAGLMDALPAPLYQIVRTANESLPGLRPSLSSIRCGRTSGSQQVTFDIDTALPLANLKPLMDNLGLGQHHGSLMTTCAFVLGARFTLPPDTATLTFRPTRVGVEMRLDVNLDALPDPPSQLAPLLRLQMAERPTSVRALDRWLMALTPDGYPGPGHVSVLSILVRPDMPARVALYLRPIALEPDADAAPNGNSAQAPAAIPGAPAPAAAASYWR
jgi:hypothetical protein